MPQSIREIMTTGPVTCPSSTTVSEAAEFLRDRDIGDVLVERDGKLCGVVTDRDMVVRGIAEGIDPAKATLGDFVTGDVVTLSPDDSVADAISLMRGRALRRLPVVEGGKAVGIVTIGDLAIERDEDSALADISSAPPNN
jgi:CBS domain-containing protein